MRDCAAHNLRSNYRSDTPHASLDGSASSDNADIDCAMRHAVVRVRANERTKAARDTYLSSLIELQRRVWPREGSHPSHHWIGIFRIYAVVIVKCVGDLRRLCASVATIAQIVLDCVQRAPIVVASVCELA